MLVCAQVQLLNYRGDGTPFWNHLHIAPIRNHDGGLAHFVGIQLDVTDASAGKGLEPTSQPTVRVQPAPGIVLLVPWIQQCHLPVCLMLTLL